MRTKQLSNREIKNFRKEVSEGATGKFTTEPRYEGLRQCDWRTIAAGEGRGNYPNNYKGTLRAEAIADNLRELTREDGPCAECGTNGDHYCPADVARGDE